MSDPSSSEPDIYSYTYSYTCEPTPSPTLEPTLEPTPHGTSEPTPSAVPTTATPTFESTFRPTDSLTFQPTYGGDPTPSPWTERPSSVPIATLEPTYINAAEKDDAPPIPQITLSIILLLVVVLTGMWCNNRRQKNRKGEAQRLVELKTFERMAGNSVNAYPSARKMNEGFGSGSFV